jgi:hypothetical protein
MGSTAITDVALAAPVHFDRLNPDWDSITQVVREAGYDPDAVRAASWCSFGKMNIEALVDSPALAMVFPTGIVSTAGKRKIFGSGMKYSTIPFASCRAYGPADHTDPRGLGKFCIEFGGAGDVLLGRLQWTWRAKRFRDSSAEIMAVAEERDRILEVVTEFLG